MPPQLYDCSLSQPILVTEPRGNISSFVTDETGCGGSQNPWRIQASAGQSIKLTLLDFGPADPAEHCKVYAIVKDLDTAKPDTICGGVLRDPDVYSHAVDIRIITRDQTAHFLLQYEGECLQGGVNVTFIVLPAFKM